MTITIDEWNHVTTEHTTIDELAEFIISHEIKKHDLHVQLQATIALRETLDAELQQVNWFLASGHRALEEHLANKARRRRHTP